MVAVANGPGPVGRRVATGPTVLALSSGPPHVQEEIRGVEPGSLAAHPERTVD